MIIAVNVETAARPIAAPRATTAREPRERGGPAIGQALLYVVLFALAALFMFPLLWLVVTSLKTPASVFDRTFWPDPWYP